VFGTRAHVGKSCANRPTVNDEAMPAEAAWRGWGGKRKAKVYKFINKFI
jgi:hypothetical protein